MERSIEKLRIIPKEMISTNILVKIHTNLPFSKQTMSVAGFQAEHLLSSLAQPEKLTELKVCLPNARFVRTLVTEQRTNRKQFCFFLIVENCSF